jgi:release factor glutamine methyltransferase
MLAQEFQNAIHLLTAGGISTQEAVTESRALLRHITGLTREQMLMQPDFPMSDEQTQWFHELIQRRSRREPLAYIIGEREFYGMRFRVTPDVLIPRPETELLVAVALSFIPPLTSPLVADIGTGSGCIAIAVAVHAPEATVYATDLSEAALQVARENVQRLTPTHPVTLLQGDLLSPLPKDRLFTVIVSNPPYIAPSEIATLEPEVRDFEPRIALGENPDALHFYRRLAREAPDCLQSSGILAVEVGQGQADVVSMLWEEAGFSPITILPDLAGIPRVVIGQKPGTTLTHFPFSSE